MFKDFSILESLDGGFALQESRINKLVHFFEIVICRLSLRRDGDCFDFYQEIFVSQARNDEKSVDWKVSVKVKRWVDFVAALMITGC